MGSRFFSREREDVKPGDKLLTCPWSSGVGKRWVTITDGLNVELESGEVFNWDFFFKVNHISKDEDGALQIK